MNSAPTTQRLAALRARVKTQPPKKPSKKTTPAKKALAVTTAPTPEKKPEIAYIIKDKVFGEFPVNMSANAWWMESTKLELLVNAFKYRATHVQASIAAGITLAQLKYFLEQHPDFYAVIDACREVSSLKAKQTMVQALDKDLTTVRWFLEATEAGEYAKKGPSVAVQINMHERVKEDRGEYT